MKEKIEILNIGKFKKKDGSGYGSVLTYRMISDVYLVNSRFNKGFPLLNIFTNNEELFNALNDTDFGVACEVEYSQYKDYKNPLNTKMKASKLKIGTSTINLS